MHRLFSGTALLFIFLTGYMAPAKTADAEKATLNIYYSNDLIGYLTPCG